MKQHPLIKSLILILVILPLTFALPAWSSEKEISRFRKKLDSILEHPCLKRKNFGIEIYSLDNREILYEIKKDQLFIPASNLKLITTAVALKNLGPNYRFPTRLYTNGRREGDTLFGDLYIKGFGDPKLVTEQMWVLVNELKNLPIKKIVGNIIADDTFFDSLRGVKTWKKNRGPQAYNAPLGALSFNFNTVTVFVKPGKTIGAPPRVILEPDTRYLGIKNQAKTLPPRKRGRLTLNRIDQGDKDIITLAGGISRRNHRSRFFVNITDPTIYTASVFREYLDRVGIKVIGKIQKGTVPEGAGMLVNHQSEPLALALRGLNKFSNNFVAEQILKTLGAETFGPPGTTEKGVQLVHDYMQSLGYGEKEYTIVDGSGLSRDNRLTPDQIVTVLDHVYRDMSIFPEFISALGVMGVDGNVKKRMNGFKASQKARVKTGTLNRVSSLSGYFQSMDGEQFAFSILMNDFKCQNRQALKIQDRIVREGLKFKRKEPPLAEEADLKTSGLSPASQ